MKQAIRYLLIFVAIQLIGGAIIQGVWSLVAGSGDKTAAMLITITGVVGLLTITVFLWARYAVVSPSLDGADVECHCRLGSTYPVSLYSRADT